VTDVKLHAGGVETSDLTTLKVAELQALAAEIGLPGANRLRKGELVEAIAAARAASAPADATAEPEEPKDETSFHTLLLELDDMEQGIKTDFDDLLRDGAAEPDAQVSVEVEPEPEDDILGVAEAREKLLAAVAALEQPPLSDEEDEARALAEAIENERRQFED